jgi:hypothetical protein
MNAEIVAAERAREAREAARAWRRNGFISEEILSRVLALYPDDRKRFGNGFRTLAFIFTGIAAVAMIGLWFAFFDRSIDSAGSYVLWAFVLAGLTEFQRGPMKRGDAGAESATALMAVLFAGIAGMLAIGDRRYDDLPLRFLTSTFLACVLAAFRWGDRAFFLVAGLSGFGLLAQVDEGRLLWIVVSSLLVPVCVRAARAERLAPSHRRGAVILGAVALLALYAAVHIWSLDEHVVESMRMSHSGSFASASPKTRTLSILATALLPPCLFLIGWRRREPLLLYAGLLLLGASIATIRHYREVMPLSFALILIGAACVAIALFGRRWLRSGEKGERGGFTADPLFDNRNRTEAIRSVVAMASFTPAAQPAASPKAFEGGGGGFGGGGATGSFE